MEQASSIKRKILFASVPADGHFNPLTGISKYLQSQGHDVRWYASKSFTSKLQKLNLPQYVFDTAPDVNGSELDEKYPERRAIKNPIGKLSWDIINFFIKPAPAYLKDITNLKGDFDFDVLICDSTFTGAPLVQGVLKKPIIGVGVMPLAETSKDLAPSGLGLTPSTGFAGRIKQSLLRFLVTKVMLAKPDKIMREVLEAHNVAHDNIFVFDLMTKKSDLYFQSGSPGFEYKRSDLSKKVRFIGSLLPYSEKTTTNTWYDERVKQYKKVLLVTQGTVERDAQKLLVPVLDAYKDSDTLVICTTGGSHTKELRDKYPYNNIIIEDFIPFNEVMPYASVYVSNGGYGGVLLGIEHKLPLVVAGVHEGKNEICARVGYFKYGVNLSTETPKSEQIKKAVDEVISNPVYKQNISKLGEEFKTYNTNELCARYVDEVING